MSGWIERDTARRDELIRKTSAAGASRRRVAKAARLHFTRVQQIVGAGVVVLALALIAAPNSADARPLPLKVLSHASTEALNFAWGIEGDDVTDAAIPNNCPRPRPGVYLCSGRLRSKTDGVWTVDCRFAVRATRKGADVRNRTCPGEWWDS